MISIFFSFLGMVAATPYYHAMGRYVVGGSDREYASDGMWAFVSGTFYLPPAFGPGGYLTNIHWDAGPASYVAIGFYPIYPQWWTNPNTRIYGPGAYAELKVVDDLTVLYAYIDEYQAEEVAIR